MGKKKRPRRGHLFTPKKEDETICEPSEIKLRNVSEPRREYDVELLGSPEISGKLLLLADKVIFEPTEHYFSYKKMKIRVSKIKDVRFATEKDISALRVFFLGPTLDVLLKKRHNMLSLDFEDETGILHHLIFEGNNLETAIKDLIETRREAGLDEK